MTTLTEKRAHVLMGMQAPEGMESTMQARVEFSLDDAVTQEHAPFFGGYMEDMLEDMGVVEQDEADVEHFARA